MENTTATAFAPETEDVFLPVKKLKVQIIRPNLLRMVMQRADDPTMPSILLGLMLGEIDGELEDGGGPKVEQRLGDDKIAVPLRDLPKLDAFNETIIRASLVSPRLVAEGVEPNPAANEIAYDWIPYADTWHLFGVLMEGVTDALRFLGVPAARVDAVPASDDVAGAPG